MQSVHRNGLIGPSTQLLNLNQDEIDESISIMDKAFEETDAFKKNNIEK
jgi:hypothetical protein